MLSKDVGMNEHDLNDCKKNRSELALPTEREQNTAWKGSKSSKSWIQTMLMSTYIN